MLTTFSQLRKRETIEGWTVAPVTAINRCGFYESRERVEVSFELAHEEGMRVVPEHRVIFLDSITLATAR